MIRRPPRSPLTDTRLPSTPLFRSARHALLRPRQGPRRLRADRQADAVHRPHRPGAPGAHLRAAGHRPVRTGARGARRPRRARTSRTRAGGRSEEHTSELQSLMRISYAVFCLKKKKIQPKTRTTLTTIELGRNIKKLETQTSVETYQK